MIAELPEIQFDSGLIKRLPLYAALLIGFYLVRLASLIGADNGWLIDGAGHYRLNDFAGVWTAGVLANSGHAEYAYDMARHGAAQAALHGGPASEFYPWPYPPVWLPVAAALAMLPFIPAMLIWLGASGAAFVSAATAIAGSWRGALLMFALPISLLNAYVGQNGFLSAALLGGGLLLLPSRPVCAGLLFGLLAYKPHLALLLPLALLATRDWRALGAAAVTVAVWCLIASAIYGFSAWLLFFAQMGRVAEAMQTNFDLSRLQSMLGLLLALGADYKTALVFHAVLALGVATVVVMAWRASIQKDLKAAILASGTVLVSPYVFGYDLMVLAIAQAFFVRHAMREGSLQAGELVALAALNLTLAGLTVLPIPLGTLAGFSVLVLAIRRGRWLAVGHALNVAGASKSTDPRPA